MVKTMRFSKLRKKLSESDAVIRWWGEAANGGAADDSSVCSCSELASLNEEDNNVGKVDFRKFGFTVFDVPGELLTEQRPEKTETTSELKRHGGGAAGTERSCGGVGSYYGALISGAAFGAVSMGVFMVRVFGCFHHVEYLGGLTPT